MKKKIVARMPVEVEFIETEYKNKKKRITGIKINKESITKEKIKEHYNKELMIIIDEEILE